MDVHRCTQRSRQVKTKAYTYNIERSTHKQNVATDAHTPVYAISPSFSLLSLSDLISLPCHFESLFVTASLCLSATMSVCLQVRDTPLCSFAVFLSTPLLYPCLCLVHVCLILPSPPSLSLDPPLYLFLISVAGWSANDSITYVGEGHGQVGGQNNGLQTLYRQAELNHALANFEQAVQRQVLLHFKKLTASVVVLERG